MPAIVTHTTIEAFQRQYGSLWNAATAYLDGKMPSAQAAAFELVAQADFLAAVAQTRLLAELVDVARRNELRLGGIFERRVADSGDPDAGCEGTRATRRNRDAG
jgi:hypothetical protein